MNGLYVLVGLFILRLSATEDLACLKRKPEKSTALHGREYSGTDTGKGKAWVAREKGRKRMSELFRHNNTQCKRIFMRVPYQHSFQSRLYSHTSTLGVYFTLRNYIIELTYIHFIIHVYLCTCSGSSVLWLCCVLSVFLFFFFWKICLTRVCVSNMR